MIVIENHHRETTPVGSGDQTGRSRPEILALRGRSAHGLGLNAHGKIARAARHGTDGHAVRDLGHTQGRVLHGHNRQAVILRMHGSVESRGEEKGEARQGGAEDGGANWMGPTGRLKSRASGAQTGTGQTQAYPTAKRSKRVSTLTRMGIYPPPDDEKVNGSQ